MRAAANTKAEGGSWSMHRYWGPSRKWQGAEMWVPGICERVESGKESIGMRRGQVKLGKGLEITIKVRKEHVQKEWHKKKEIYLCGYPVK